MPYAQKLVKSWRAGWYVPGRKNPIRKGGFATKKEALEYAREQETDARRKRPRADAHQLTFREWAQEWYAALDVEPSTMRNYTSILQNHLLRQWGEWNMKDLENADQAIAAWKKQLLSEYTEGTANGISSKLFTILADAVEQGIIYLNPAVMKRRRGKVAPKRKRQREARYDHVTDPLGACLIAERAAYLSERDDEFVFVLEDVAAKRIIGTSMIYAQHGTKRAPHIFFRVEHDERYSVTIDRYMVHRTLRIGYNYNGPTEIGGLILATAGSALTWTAAATAAQGQPDPRVIRAQAFVLEDENGARRGILAVNADGPGLAFHDRNGRRRTRTWRFCRSRSWPIWSARGRSRRPPRPRTAPTGTAPTEDRPTLGVGGLERATRRLGREPPPSARSVHGVRRAQVALELESRHAGT